MAKRWYVVHAYSGYEKKVMHALNERIALSGMEEHFDEVLVPTEEVVEMRAGQKRKSERKFFPGYVLVHMDLNDDTWHLVKETPRVMGFIGGTAEKLLRRTTDKSHHPWCLFNQMPGVVIQIHMNQDITREKFPLTLTLLPRSHFHHFFGRNQYFIEVLFHTRQGDALIQGVHNLFLVARVSVNHIPAFSHCLPLTDHRRNHAVQAPIQKPEYQRHNENDDEDDDCCLRSFLPRWPNHLSDFYPGIQTQRHKGFTFDRLRCEPPRRARYHQQAQCADQQRFC